MAKTKKTAPKPTAKKPTPKPTAPTKQTAAVNRREALLDKLVNQDAEREADLKLLSDLLAKYGLVMLKAATHPHHAIKFVHVGKPGSTNHPYGVFFIPNNQADGLTRLYVFGVRE